MALQEQKGCVFPPGEGTGRQRPFNAGVPILSGVGEEEQLGQVKTRMTASGRNSVQGNGGEGE